MTMLLDAIRSHAAARGGDVAIDGAGPITWTELARVLPTMAANLATRFADGRPVATRIDHGVGECLLNLALFEAGVPTIPLPPFFTPAQTAHALDAAGAQALLTGPVAPDFACETFADRVPRALPPGTARITFTSGSTGEPKGICLSRDHISRVAGAVVETLGVHHAGRHLPLLPPGILLENVAGLHATMLAGGTYVALPQAEVGMADGFRPDLAAMLYAIAAHRITSLSFASSASASSSPPMDAAVQRINDQWAHIRYEVGNRDQQYRQLDQLAVQAAKVAAQYPGRAEPLLWQGIVVSEEAARATMFAQLGLARSARDILEKAQAIDPNIADGGVKMSLGVLYYRVPGFPIGFGSTAKARTLLESALRQDPAGLDNNFFYADFLNDEGHPAQAKTYVLRGLQAPVSTQRPVWDAGRRAEMRALLARINAKLKSA